MNGDSYTEFNLNSLLLSHEQQTANITILIKNIDDTSRFGSIQMNEENEIIEFIEKKHTEESGLINAGVYLINRSVLEKISKKTPCSLEYDFFPNMIGKGIYGYETRSKFIDIGIPESYAIAKTFFEKKPVSV